MSNKFINVNLKDNQYFEIDRYLHLADTFVIKGARGVGKSYSCIDTAFKDLCSEHRPLVYCRLTDREFKGVIGTFSELYPPTKLLKEANIDFNDSLEPEYIRGKPAKTITVKYRNMDNQLKYFMVAILCDVYQAASYKGFAAEVGKEPKWFILDEFTNGIDIFTGDVELKTLDLLETFFRDRDYKALLLTNNNNENNAFKNIFDECVFIKITKPRKTRTNDKNFNNYIEGKSIEYDLKSLSLIGYYYLTSRDIVGVYRHNKLDILLMKQENFEDKKHKAKKDKSIFDINCQFIDEWCKNVFRIAKNNYINLYD